MDFSTTRSILGKFGLEKLPIVEIIILSFVLLQGKWVLPLKVKTSNWVLFFQAPIGVLAVWGTNFEVVVLKVLDQRIQKMVLVLIGV